ncbi:MULTISPECIES: hypothetical protein [Moorena]|uniref:Uncharacterized protein n=1 Tax=Moorena producens (strain JHB) TaxID=1454205 RepID=A0A1D9G889_MOOP1|nr:MULTISPECIES: hypothetical protein [Moorena]AOY83610.1 hypothetical protein BJP36_30510 [Moorena producens JHB]NEP36509.1 hypothetical protein [Moorena sp. SIO3B2]
MSTEERLRRLGLEHLKDKPEELEKELERRLLERQKQEEEWLSTRKKQPDDIDQPGNLTETEGQTSQEAHEQTQSDG